MIGSQPADEATIRGDLTATGVLEDTAWVMATGSLDQHVHLDPAAIEVAGRQLATTDVPVPAWNAQWHFTDGTPRTANYLALLDTLNFSFWAEPPAPRWGIDYEGKALSGYWALAAALKRAIEEGLALDDAQTLASLDAATLAHVLRGRGTIPLFETRLALARSLGVLLQERYGGQFVQAIACCNHSAVALAHLLATTFPGFDDTSPYAGRRVRLYKRAQILPADLYGAFAGQGPGEFRDLACLTAFADYKVPQVLNRLGILRYAPALAERLVAGTQLAPHGAEEVEIRAATIQGVELVRQAMARHGRELLAIEVDWILWEMGLKPDPADLPYHLTRTTAY